MTAIVEQIRKPSVQTGLAVAGKSCLVVGGLAVAQSAAALVVFSL